MTFGRPDSSDDLVEFSRSVRPSAGIEGMVDPETEVELATRGGDAVSGDGTRGGSTEASAISSAIGGVWCGRDNGRLSEPTFDVSTAPIDDVAECRAVCEGELFVGLAR